MDSVRKLILERLDELKLKRKEVSIAMGRNETYLHQFLHRGVPIELHERDRARLSVILKVPEMQLRGPLAKAPHLKENMAPPKSFIERATVPPYRTEAEKQEASPIPELFAGTDLPVYGRGKMIEGGIALITERPINWVARPSMLARVEDAYGLIVADAMALDHKQGSTALVNPHLVPKIGDSCVYRCRPAGENADFAIVREYRGETESHYKVRQINPDKDLNLKKADWHACHKTVGNYFA